MLLRRLVGIKWQRTYRFKTWSTQINTFEHGCIPAVCSSRILELVCVSASWYHSRTSTTCLPGLETWSRHDSPSPATPALWVKWPCERVCTHVCVCATSSHGNVPVVHHSRHLYFFCGITVNLYFHVNSIKASIRVIFEPTWSSPSGTFGNIYFLYAFPVWVYQMYVCDWTWLSPSYLAHLCVCCKTPYMKYSKSGENWSSDLKSVSLSLSLSDQIPVELHRRRIPISHIS